MASEELYCMECVEGRPVALGLCADCLAGEPLEEVIRQIARLSRELEAALERERRLREAILAELHGADGVAVTEIGPDGVRRLWEALVQTEARDG